MIFRKSSIFLRMRKVLIFLLSWKVWKTESILSGSIMCPQFRAASLEEWEHLGLEEPLSLENIQYLKKRCIPCQKNSHIRADGGKLEFMETLKAHEIRLIKITRK